MKEQFLSHNNQSETIGDKILSEIISLEKQKNEFFDAKRKDIVEYIDFLKKYINENIDEEGKEYLLLLDIKDLQTIFSSRGIFDNDKFEKKKISKKNIQNFSLYRKVYGYGHPELEKREKENPMPTAEEVLLGCYGEMLEAQTREAVFILRRKGYDTVQSGFYDHLDGSQFFDISEKEQTVVPESIIETIRERFAILIEQKRLNDLGRTQIIFNSAEFTTLEEWKTILDYFANAIPEKGEQVFASSGAGLAISYDAITKYKKEDILKTATTERQKDLIEQLYACKDKKELLFLLTNNEREVKIFEFKEELKKRIATENSLENRDVLQNIKESFEIIPNLTEESKVEAFSEIKELRTKLVDGSELSFFVDKIISFVKNDLM